MNQIKIDMNSLFTFLHKHFKKDTLLPQQVTINTFLRDYLGQNIKKKSSQKIWPQLEHFAFSMIGTSLDIIIRCMYPSDWPNLHPPNNPLTNDSQNSQEEQPSLNQIANQFSHLNPQWQCTYSYDWFNIKFSTP